MTTGTRRVIDPETRFSLVRTGDVEDMPGERRCDIVGLRCECCGETAPLGEEVDHAEGCEQEDVELQTGRDQNDGGQ